jgi:hypothetical protein
LLALAGGHYQSPLAFFDYLAPNRELEEPMAKAINELVANMV